MVFRPQGPNKRKEARLEMTGRRLCSEEEAVRRGFFGAECARRRRVLRETIAAFEQADPPDYYHRLAKRNLKRWRGSRKETETGFKVDVVPGDWGDVTHTFTKRYGTPFAVLNMANAYVPGGAYVEGAAAQEENMFRRTDCHFRIGEDEYDEETDRYYPEMTRLISARDGRVYLDTQFPRVCIRGPEDRSREDLGYPWLPPSEVFSFYELRSAAQDLRAGSDFDPKETRKRISAQLDTLRDHQVRHVVLGAFGCGAFMNPAEKVAKIYREEIAARSRDFTVIAFAILRTGYGPDNFGPFAEVFG